MPTEKEITEKSNHAIKRVYDWLDKVEKILSSKKHPVDAGKVDEILVAIEDEITAIKNRLTSETPETKEKGVYL